MNRSRVILLIAVLALVLDIGWMIYSRWGLITVHAKGQPLSEVVRSIERQGGIAIRTDLDATAPVTMNVTRVHLREALETLATVTESNWRLTYVVAGNKNDISSALANFAAGQKSEGWKTIYVPLRPVSDVEIAPNDPRDDTWSVTQPSEKALHAYLDEGALNVSAQFLVPADWNPPVNASISSGAIHKIVPKLAKSARGTAQEVFFFTKTRGRGDFVRGGGEDGADRMEQRMVAEIAKLPPKARAEAQAELNEVRNMRKNLADLPAEERRAKMAEYFQDPKFQDRMEQRQNDRESRMTPEQRVQRAQRYAQRRQDVRNGGQK